MTNLTPAWANLTRKKNDLPPRILIYGQPGIGKTSLAAEFPDAVFLQTEDGAPGDIEITTFGHLTSYDAFMTACGELYMNGEGQVKTVVVDSLSELQKLVFAETCRRGDEKGNAKANIEDFGYGKGYVLAQTVMGEVVAALNDLRREKGMSIVLVGHAVVQRFDDPLSVSYDRYQIDLNKHIVAQIEREMDAILLLKSPVALVKDDDRKKDSRITAKGGHQVMIHATPSAAYVAKNRLGIPETTPYLRGNGYAALSQYLPAPKVVALASKGGKKTEEAA